MINASETIEFVLTGIGSIRNRLIMNGNYAVIFEDGTSLNDIPEVIANGIPCCFGGVYKGGTANVLVSPEHSLVCDPFDGSIVTFVAGNIFIHEMAHMIGLGAIRLLDSGFQSTIVSRCSSPISSGLWSDS